MQNEIIGDLFDDDTPRAIPVKVMKIWRLCFMDRKGGYRERVYTDADKLSKACAKLCAEATIKDAQGNAIGRVEQAHWGYRRRKWNWYFEIQNECDTRTHFTEAI